MIILGLKPYGHDTNAAIVKDGKIIAASAEERFDRIKHSRAFPINAIDFCMSEADINDLNKVDEIAIGFNYIKFAYYQHLINLFKYFPEYNLQALKDITYQLKKIYNTRKILKQRYNYKGRITYHDHHDCHAVLCYFTSGFSDSAILTIDGRGENASARIYKAENYKLTKLYQYNYPQSLGGYYSAITKYLGFQENSGEGKVMGLSSYGDDSYLTRMRKVVSTNLNQTYHINLKYFKYHKDYRDSVSEKFEKEFGEKRLKDEKITSRHENIAKAAQVILEEAVINLANKAKYLTSKDNLCMSGGVVLNSVANGKLLFSNLFKEIYIYPAAGDDGIGIGAALMSYNKKQVKPSQYFIENKSPYLGYEASEEEIINELDKHNLKYKKSVNIAEEAAVLLAKNKFIGWFQGKAEIGPRALGNRSIIVNPTFGENKDIVNAKIKFRESFRPFAPSTLLEHSDDWFDNKGIESPYMILAFDVKPDKIKKIPAVTHVDGTARLQTVKKSENSRYWDLINEFYKLTGIPVVLDTSFNVKDQPIVNTPRDAVDCFLNCGLDVLVIGDYIVIKDE